METFRTCLWPQFSPQSCIVRRLTNRGAFCFAISQGTDAVQHLDGFVDRFPMSGSGGVPHLKRLTPNHPRWMNWFNQPTISKPSNLANLELCFRKCLKTYQQPNKGLRNEPSDLICDIYWHISLMNIPEFSEKSQAAKVRELIEFLHLIMNPSLRSALGSEGIWSSKWLQSEIQKHLHPQPPLLHYQSGQLAVTLTHLK